MAQGFKTKSKAPAKKSKVTQKQKQKSKQLSKGRKAFSAKGRKAALAKQDAETSKAINRKNEVTVAARAVGSGNTFFLNDIKEAGKKEIGKKNAQLRKKESKSIKMSERLTQQLNKLSKMMPSLLAAAAGAVVVVLSGASTLNMFDTFSLAQNHNNNKLLSSSPDVTTRAASWKSIDEAMHELQTMSRRDLVALYLDCEQPDIDGLTATSEQTEENWVYDGYLLSNGPILTIITNFITNKLFGRGLKWMGKTYFSSNSSVFIGKNRFGLEQNAEQKSIKGISDVLLDRTFDYYIGKSALCSGSSLINRYSPHYSRWSPMSLIWRGMVDELRVIPLSVDAECNVVSTDQTHTQRESKKRAVLLLGMGYFTWSGGAWNSAPFCLVAKQEK